MHFRNKDALSLGFTVEEPRERYRFGRESIMFLSYLVRKEKLEGTMPSQWSSKS
jgi:hypothetical protein